MFESMDVDPPASPGNGVTTPVDRPGANESHNGNSQGQGVIMNFGQISSSQFNANVEQQKNQHASSFSGFDSWLRSIDPEVLEFLRREEETVQRELLEWLNAQQKLRVNPGTKQKLRNINEKARDASGNKYYKTNIYLEDLREKLRSKHGGSLENLFFDISRMIPDEAWEEFVMRALGLKLEDVKKIRPNVHNQMNKTEMLYMWMENFKITAGKNPTSEDLLDSFIEFLRITSKHNLQIVIQNFNNVDAGTFYAYTGGGQISEATR